ncbi:MAG: RDD family protein [Carbonactinosporaceae bacterium]
MPGHVPDLVTGEAVVLELRLARVPSRALALLLDLAVQGLALFFLIALLVVFSPNFDDALASVVTLLSVVAVLVGYPVTLETISRGRTLGKAVLGLRVVRDDGGPIRFRHALVRGLTGFFVDFGLFGLFGCVALITSLASAQGKRVGDILAGTVVVRERMPRQGGGLTPMPPQLAAWAAGLELAQLPDDLALAARQYLTRRQQLDPGTSEDVARRLAGDVQRYVARPAPPGTPAWAYLAAVTAERRQREINKLVTRQNGAPPAGPPAAPQVAPQVAQAAGQAETPKSTDRQPAGHQEGPDRPTGPAPQERARPTPGGFAPPD